MMYGYGVGWMGGYGGIWVPILLVLLVGGLVAWVVKQKEARGAVTEAVAVEVFPSRSRLVLATSSRQYRK